MLYVMKVLPLRIHRRLFSSSRLRLPALIATSTGECRCGNISFSAQFTSKLDRVQPRRCDCDFCVARDVKYASDPNGVLQFEVKNRNKIKFVKQDPGSNAEFIICTACDTLTGVVFKPPGEEGLIGTVNASIARNSPFAADVSVSPKLLNAEQKIQRWKENWFHGVTITYKDGES